MFSVTCFPKKQICLDEGNFECFDVERGEDDACTAGVMTLGASLMVAFIVVDEPGVTSISGASPSKWRVRTLLEEVAVTT
jgi:hypothetical protein